jgi:hypothetical protein
VSFPSVFWCRGGTPLFILGKRWCWKLYLAWSMHSIAFACQRGTAIARRGRKVPRGYSSHPLGAAGPWLPPLATAFVYHMTFLWFIKDKARHPIGRIFFRPTKGTSTPLHFHQRPRSSSLFRPFVTPTTDPSASNMSSSPLDVGTFSPNQYTTLCPLCTPSESKHAIIEIY